MSLSHSAAAVTRPACGPRLVASSSHSLRAAALRTSFNTKSRGIGSPAIGLRRVLSHVGHACPELECAPQSSHCQRTGGISERCEHAVPILLGQVDVADRSVVDCQAKLPCAYYLYACDVS
jgi:hypothetical protein